MLKLKIRPVIKCIKIASFFFMLLFLSSSFGYAETPEENAYASTWFQSTAIKIMTLDTGKFKSELEASNVVFADTAKQGFKDGLENAGIARLPEDAKLHLTMSFMEPPKIQLVLENKFAKIWKIAAPVQINFTRDDGPPPNPFSMALNATFRALDPNDLLKGFLISDWHFTLPN